MISTTKIVLASLLAAVALSCSSEPPSGGNPEENCEARADSFYAGLTKASEDGAITAEIASADPAPPANSNDNTWRILLSKGGVPLTGAEIVGAPYMVDHGHGAPAALSSELGDGKYNLGPLKLRMAGLWQVTLKITQAGTADSAVVFNFCIPKD